MGRALPSIQQSSPIHVMYLNFLAGQPIRVVAAENENEFIIITAYYPEKSIWMTNFRTKRRNS